MARRALKTKRRSRPGGEDAAPEERSGRGAGGRDDLSIRRQL
ncbi:hypothetical protein HMPREF3293_01410 [Christensenella minuta]|uniref:Uncharacterized protein n=1 Tax=Christensenella minuta TaxID=626937 RepID=A0A136Q4S2_9FIRM|nr:hypothetical protein HMPREF3293_01410 [Christensenella minuta]